MLPLASVQIIGLVKGSDNDEDTGNLERRAG